MLPSFADFIKMNQAMQHPHRAGFAALNLTPVLTSQKFTGLTPCSNCEGAGHYAFDNGNPSAYKPRVECEECGGSGTVSISREDFMETQEAE